MILNLNGFDVRFSYDSSKLQTSSVQTNEPTDIETEFFEFEDEFKDYLEFWTMPADPGIVEASLVFWDEPENETDHIKEKEGIGKIIDTNGGVLLGKMSFQLAKGQSDLRKF